MPGEGGCNPIAQFGARIREWAPLRPPHFLVGRKIARRPRKAAESCHYDWAGSWQIANLGLDYILEGPASMSLLCNLAGKTWTAWPSHAMTMRNIGDAPLVASSHFETVTVTTRSELVIVFISV
jgi:hypothetical protein